MTDRMMVVVTGPPRTGTSCTSGMLHRLGVSMGVRFWPPKPLPQNPLGFYEEAGLRVYLQRCRRRRQPPTKEWFQGYASRRTETPIVGCKHPDLCKWLPVMAEAWERLVVVATDRPTEHAFQSFKDTGWAGATKRKRRRVRRLCYPRYAELRDKAVADLQLPCLVVPYYDTVRAPEAMVDRLIEFLHLSPTKAQIEAAVAYVDPDLCHQRPS